MSTNLFIFALLIVAFGFYLGSGEQPLNIKNYKDIIFGHAGVMALNLIMFLLISFGFALAKLFAKFNS